MRRRRTWGSRTKAKVVTDMLTGWTVEATTERHGVPVGTAKVWSAARGSIVATMQRQKRAELRELQLGCLRASLETVQLPCRRDPEWLARQQGTDLAALHSVQEEARRLLDELGQPHQAERMECP